MNKKEKLPTASRLLQRVSDVFEAIDLIRKELKRKQAEAFSVTFYHIADRTLLKTQWSDQYYGASDYKNVAFTYTYSIGSNGIHFKGYAEHNPTNYFARSKRSWYNSGDESSMSLMDVPNIPPPNYKGTSMYIFHQEKIKETLSALPAWAILCGTEH